MNARESRKEGKAMEVRRETFYVLKLQQKVFIGTKGGKMKWTRTLPGLIFNCTHSPVYS